MRLKGGEYDLHGRLLDHENPYSRVHMAGVPEELHGTLVAGHLEGAALVASGCVWTDGAHARVTALGRLVLRFMGNERRARAACSAGSGCRSRLARDHYDEMGSPISSAAFMSRPSAASSSSRASRAHYNAGCARAVAVAARAGRGQFGALAWLLTLHPTGAGCTYAAYGGVYVVASIGGSGSWRGSLRMDGI